MLPAGPSVPHRVAVATAAMTVLGRRSHLVAWLAGLKPRWPTSTIITTTNGAFGRLASGRALVLIATR